MRREVIVLDTPKTPIGRAKRETKVFDRLPASSSPAAWFVRPAPMGELFVQQLRTQKTSGPKAEAGKMERAERSRREA
ncbi:hypothetical protein TomMM35A_20340 [Sphingobium sp. TomMM35A]